MLAEHRRLVRAAIAGQGGYEVDTQGDAFFAAFAEAKQAVLCALDIQRALAAHDWPDGLPVRVRIGIHTGQAVPAERAYTGVAVHRAARIAAVARGGQVLVSQATATIIEDEEEAAAGFTLVDLGERELRGLDRPVRLFELAVPERAAAGSGLVWAGCPYLGLVPFEEQDAPVFYGRGDLAGQFVQRLAGRLDGPGIVLVAGESGVGKSSLLRAGLMPRLAAGALGPGSGRWPRRVIRPAASPLRELAAQLAEVAGTDPVSVYRSLLAAPDEAPMLIDLAVRTATGRGPESRSRTPGDPTAAAPPRLVLVVDQFEELFTAGRDEEAGRAEREAFIAALHAAASCPTGPRNLPTALVVAAVRADFLGRLIAYPPLKAALDAGPFTVGPMSEAELRAAITGPAAEAGLAVEPAVVEAIIAELREGAGGGLDSGVLPLMSQAMAATWEYREGSQLTLRGYLWAGGVADAVNRSAQAAYDTLTSPQQDAARQVFTQLTTRHQQGVP